MQNKYIKKILEADVYDVAIQSPMEQAQVLSERLESEVFLKREDLQPASWMQPHEREVSSPPQPGIMRRVLRWRHKN